MAKKTSTLFKEMVEQSKSKLPSSRIANICIGCFAPRNTLTIKPHTLQVFKKEQMRIEQDPLRVLVTCLYCSEWRQINMSSFSVDVLQADYQEYSDFMVVKDHKEKCELTIGCGCYTSMVGIDPSFSNEAMTKYLGDLRAKFIEKAQEAQ